MESVRTLVLGWGNPGRLDDGLGPAFVDALGELPSGVVADANYQLTMEDAADIVGYDRVIFVDADRIGPEPFGVGRVRPEARSASFSTHSVTPGAVLALARDLFQAEPEAWLVGIRGYCFDEFGEVISAPARANLDRAVRFFHAAVADGQFREFPDRRESIRRGRQLEDES